MAAASRIWRFVKTNLLRAEGRKYYVDQGRPFFFSTAHVELFNFDPPDRGGGYLTPSPPLNTILIPISNRTQGKGESRPPSLL